MKFSPHQSDISITNTSQFRWERFVMFEMIFAGNHNIRDQRGYVFLKLINALSSVCVLQCSPIKVHCFSSVGCRRFVEGNTVVYSLLRK